MLDVEIVCQHTFGLEVYVTVCDVYVMCVCVCLCVCVCVFVQCVSGHRAEEAVEMLKTFYKQENPNGELKLSLLLFHFFVFVSSFFAATSSSVGSSVSWLAHKNSPLFDGHIFRLRRLKYGMEVKCVCECVRVCVCVHAS